MIMVPPGVSKENILVFSYGANMAQQTLSRRYLNPVHSYQARILDETLAISFQHRSAFATLIKTRGPVREDLCISNPFGVVHQLTLEDFRKVQEREVGYKICRLKNVCLLETGEKVDCETFVSLKWMLLPHPMPPTNRYKSLLLSGSIENKFASFGGSDYVQWLQNVPSVESREISIDPRYSNTVNEKAARVLGLFLFFCITSFIVLKGK